MTFLLNPYVFDDSYTFDNDLIIAYSLRNIGDYSGSVILGYRVADASTQQFTASEITDGTLETFANGSNVLVQTLYNQGSLGASANATQANSSLMLKIYDGTTGFITQNGKPALNGGSFARLLSPYVISLDLTNGFSVFTTAGTTNTGTDIRFVVSMGNTFVNNTDRMYQLTYALNNIQSQVQGSTLRLLQTKTTEQKVFSSHCQNTNFSFLVNGGSALSSNSSLAPFTKLPHRISIGHFEEDGSGTGFGLFTDTYFQEVLVFNTIQDANDTAIVNSINSYYGAF
jgi:hypothetical protein